MTTEEIQAKFLLYAQELATQADLIRELTAAYRESVHQQKLTRRLLRRFVREMRGDDKDDWWKRDGGE